MPTVMPILISMADISRLAGQSRSTVGNWKARENDFPPEHSRGNRGPLYDKAVVVAWLEAKGRLAKPQAGGAGRFHRIPDTDGHPLDLDDAGTASFMIIAMRLGIPPGAWERISNATQRQLEPLLRRTLDEEYPGGNLLLPHGLPASFLATLVEQASKRDHDANVDMMDGQLDSLFESPGLLGGRRGYQFLTPMAVCQVVAALTRPAATVYDPASGACRLLAEVAAAQPGDTPALYGQELNLGARLVGDLNLRARGLDARVELDNVLYDDKLRDRQFDLVVCDPPWGELASDSGTAPDDPRWVWGDPEGDASIAWIQHCLYHLEPHGSAVIVLPSRVLFDRARPSSARALQGIVKAGYLDAVVTLPQALYPRSSVAFSIVVFVKGRPMVDGNPAPTLMINIDDDQLSGDARHRSLPPAVIAGVRRVYQEWAKGKHPDDQMAEVAGYQELVENAFDLSPRRYVRPVIDLPEPDVLRAERDELVQKISRSLDASRSADRRLLKLMSEGS
jgi:hypothetical protein